MTDLPCDCEYNELHALRGPQAGMRGPTEAPAVADVGHSPRQLYTINSSRSRYQIVADYAARHDLSAKQVDELVRALPDYGVRSMLAGSVATLRRGAEIIELSAVRARLARRRR